VGSLFGKIVAQPRIYDAVQRAFGLEVTRRRLIPLLALASGGRVLDVGGGTGLFRPVVPASARYFVLDIDPLKLHGFATAYPKDQGILCDATHLSLRDKSIDVVMCVAVAHHLTDPQLAAMVDELARVVKRGLIFLDPLDRPRSLVSYLLWRYDRGAYPRSVEALRAALEARFTCEHAERYVIYHEYLLWLGRPTDEWRE